MRGGRFAIDADTGEITVANANAISHRSNTSHEITVKVTDTAGHSITDTMTIEVSQSHHAPVRLSMDMAEGDEFALHTYTAGDQSDPNITALDNGGFVSVWYNSSTSTSTGGDGSSHSIKARFYNEDGQAVGGEFLVNQNTTNSQAYPSVTTLTDGDVLVTWSSHHGSGYRVYGRRYDENGTAKTGEITLFESAGSHQYSPDVSALEDGGYIVSWHDNSLDGNSTGVFAQRFDSDNRGMGQVQVNRYSTGLQAGHPILWGWQMAAMLWYGEAMVLIKPAIVVCI